MKKSKKITMSLAGTLLLSLFVHDLSAGRSNYGTAEYETLSKMNAAMFADSETCEDDCGFDAQAGYGRNVEQYRDELGACLDAAIDATILAYVNTLSWQDASSNIPTVWDTITETQPEAMACLNAAGQNFEDMIGATGDDWVDCSNSCDL